MYILQSGSTKNSNNARKKQRYIHKKPNSSNPNREGQLCSSNKQ